MIIIMIIAIPTVAVVIPVVGVVVPKVAVVVVAVRDLRVVHFSTHFVSASVLLLKCVAEIFQLSELFKLSKGGH